MRVVGRGLVVEQDATRAASTSPSRPGAGASVSRSADDDDTTNGPLVTGSAGKVAAGVDAAPWAARRTRGWPAPTAARPGRVEVDAHDRRSMSRRPRRRARSADPSTATALYPVTSSSRSDTEDPESLRATRSSVAFTSAAVTGEPSVNRRVVPQREVPVELVVRRPSTTPQRRHRLERLRVVGGERVEELVGHQQLVDRAGLGRVERRRADDGRPERARPRRRRRPRLPRPSSCSAPPAQRRARRATADSPRRPDDGRRDRRDQTTSSTRAKWQADGWPWPRSVSAGSSFDAVLPLALGRAP